MHKEMMEFTKNNILQQAATAMLAQANMAPSGVLQLYGNIFKGPLGAIPNCKSGELLRLKSPGNHSTNRKDKCEGMKISGM